MDMEQRQPKLAVILHADVADSTALVRREEILAHERITAAFNRLSETIECYGGMVHEIRGDALVAEFARASDAVCAALAFQRSHVAYLAELNDEIAPAVRVGISMGEVVFADGTATGSGVVLAQRVEQLAKPHGVCITAAIHEAIPDRMPFDQHDLGERQLKGFDEPVHVHTVRIRDDAELPEPRATTKNPQTTRWTTIAAATLLVVGSGLLAWLHPWYPEEPVSAEAIPLHDRPSIAVLAFDNMTGDPSQDYFSDGVTEDIITSLSRSPWLVVMSRNSSFAYKGKRMKPQQIASELGVLYLLEGSVQKSNDRVRITAQLIDARSGGHVWAEHYDEEGKDVLALQDAVTNKVMHAVGSYVGGQIRKEGTKRAWAKGSTELEEYDYLLRGHSLYFRYTKEDMARAREIFEEGLERFAGSSLLKAKLGWTLAEEATWGWSDDPVRDYQRAFGLAQQALANEAAPLLAEAIGHWLLAFLHFNHEADVASALLEQKKTVQLIPGSGMVQADLAWYQNYSGKPSDALKSLEVAIRSDPEYPWIPLYRGEALHMTAKNHEAIEALETFILDFVPDKYRLLASSYIELEMNDKARAALDKFLKLVPEASASSLRDELIYEDRTFVQRHIENLRKAGLPD